MTAGRALNRHGAGITRGRDDRALQTMAALLWESVARVADGTAPDVEDRNVIANAQSALNGQREMLNYVTNRAAAPSPPTAVRGTDTLVDMIWIAAEQLDETSLLGVSRSDGIAVLIGVLGDIREGNTAVAKTWDDLFGCVAMLVESSGSASLSY